MAAKVKFFYDDGHGKQHSQRPISTGTSVLGLVFDKGVVIAADQLASYGSMAMFRNVQRVNKLNDRTIIGCGGDYADYQYLMQVIEQKVIDEASYEDSHQISPNALHSWLTRVQYNRRSKFDPLWCTWVVGGLNDEGKPYLAYTDKLGTSYSDSIVSTGLGIHLATPMMRSAVDSKEGKLTEDEAIKVLQNCLEVLYYRDARSWNKYHLAVVNESGARIEGPHSFIGNWEFADMVTGYE